MPKKKSVKSKGKKPKIARRTNKGPMWTLEGSKVIRNRTHCPKCGPGVHMAEHYDRLHCGKCGYTKFKRAKAPRQTS